MRLDDIVATLAAKETIIAKLRQDLLQANDEANNLDSQVEELQAREDERERGRAIRDRTDDDRDARDECFVRDDTAQRQRHENTASTSISSQVSSLISMVPTQSKAIELVRGLESPTEYNATGDFDQWLQSLELRLSNASFKTQIDAMQFIQSLLDGTARQLTLARMPSRLSNRPVPNPYCSAEDMLNQVSERFGVRDVEQRAMAELSKLKQNDDESFRDFYARYQIYDVYVTVGMPELARVMTLQGKLNYRYSAKVLDGTGYSTKRELADKCCNLDRAFETLATHHPCDRNDRARVAAPSSGCNRYSRAATAPATVATTVATSATGKAPLPEKYRKLGRLSPETKEMLINRETNSSSFLSPRSRGPLLSHNISGIAFSHIVSYDASAPAISHLGGRSCCDSGKGGAYAPPIAVGDLRERPQGQDIICAP
jgi:hypothetical protein